LKITLVFSFVFLSEKVLPSRPLSVYVEYILLAEGRTRHTTEGIQGHGKTDYKKARGRFRREAKDILWQRRKKKKVKAEKLLLRW